jgi:hypothetical protein
MKRFMAPKLSQARLEMEGPAQVGGAVKCIVQKKEEEGKREKDEVCDQRPPQGPKSKHPMRDKDIDHRQFGSNEKGHKGNEVVSLTFGPDQKAGSNEYKGKGGGYQG